MIPKIVKVGRKRWLRGKGGTESALRKKTPQSTMMCCLGFVAKACGYTNADIMDRKTPAHLPDAEDKMQGLVEYGNIDTTTCNGLMNINDNIALYEPVREQRLNDLAQKAGFRFEFVD